MMSTTESTVIDISAINPNLQELLISVKLDERFIEGIGTKLISASGHHILDFVAGFGALPLGHNPRTVHSAIAQGLNDQNPCMLQPHFPKAAITLAQRLLKLTNVEFDRIVFSNSGAEAIEVALKAARMASGRHRVLAMQGGFHGKTRGAMAVTDMIGRGVWSGADDGTLFTNFGDVTALENAITVNSRDLAAVIIEPIQGEGGINTASVEFFHRCEELCRENNIFLILDEVQTGFGRTGSVFAQEWLNITPDAMAVGKALGGGVMPIAATYLSSNIATPDFSLQHSSTFAGNKYAALAGHAFLDALQRDDFAILKNVVRRSEQLSKLHDGFLEAFPNALHQHRGIGLFRGLEIGYRDAPVAGRRGSIIALIHEQGFLPLLLAGRLLHDGVRLAPTLRQGNTLRVEPPLNVTEAEIAHYGEAMEKVLSDIERRNSSHLLVHVSGPIERSASAVLNEPTMSAKIAPKSDEGHFAFIMHPLTESSHVDFDPALGALTRHQLERLSISFASTVDPFLVSRKRLTAKDGSTTVGDFIVVPFTAKQLLDLPVDEAANIVQRAVDIAYENGAKVIGLGGYTSVVTQGGRKINARGVAITTGNSYTVLSAIKAANLASQILGINISCRTTAIIGATGSIGSGLIGLAGSCASYLILCVNPDTKFEKSLRRLANHLVKVLIALQAGEIIPAAGSVFSRLATLAPNSTDRAVLHEFATKVLNTNGSLGIEVITNLGNALPKAQLVFAATSSTNMLVEPDMLRSGAVVCDLSRPGNISYRVCDERSDVLVIDGGIIAFPGRPELGVQLNMPRGIGFACMAETAMLGLKKQFQTYDSNPTLDFAYVGKLERYAEELGFSLADLRSFDKPLGNVEWSKIKDESSIIESRPGKTDAVPEMPNSISDQTYIDFYDSIIGSKARNRGGDLAVLAADGAQLTWQELDVKAGSFAAKLCARGIGVGDTVVVAGSNSVNFVCAIAALWRLGAVPVLVEAKLQSITLNDMICSTKARLCITDSVTLQKSELQIPKICMSEFSQQASTTNDFPASQARLAAVGAVVTFTSGSTGHPKAVQHSVRDLINTSLNYGTEIAALTQADTVLTLSRLSFTYGFNVLQMALWSGATVALAPDTFNCEQTLKRLATQKPTVLFGVPTIYKLLLSKTDLNKSDHCLRLCVSAGEPLPISVADAWERRCGLGLVDGLGTSEVISTFISKRPGDPSASHLGRLVSGFEIQLCRKNGAPVLEGEAGIAWIRGNTLARSYLGDPESSESYFVDGWYNTNDILRRDCDGNYHYLGRANDMRKVGGSWLSPVQIEAVLQEHPAVAEAAVVLKEEEAPLVRPYAFVCLESDQKADNACYTALKAHITSRLSKAQAPHQFFFVDQLPRTPNQKIARFKLAERLDEQLLGRKSKICNTSEVRTT